MHAYINIFELKSHPLNTEVLRAPRFPHCRTTFSFFSEISLLTVIESHSNNRSYDPLSDPRSGLRVPLHTVDLYA